MSSYLSRDMPATKSTSVSVTAAAADDSRREDIPSRLAAKDSARIELVEINDPRWMAFARGHQDATVFHHPAWAGVLAQCYGYGPSVFAMMDSAGRITAGLPVAEVKSWLTGRRLVALPFSDFVPPLAGSNAELSKLLSHFETYRHDGGWPKLEVHWELPAQEGVYYEEPVARHLTHLAADPVEVFQRFKKTKVQQPIRQAERAGVTIRRAETGRDLELFYGLHLQTRRRLGTPVQPIRFFRLLWEWLLSQGLGFALLAYKDKELLAGAVFLHWNGVLTYKYSASDPAYWGLRPNNLLLWHAIRWGCEQGYRLFDWGRTDLHNQGLLAFKRAWGSEERLIRYSVVADQPPSGRLVGSTQRLLSSVITHSPSWVCRTIGELLYAHSA